MSIQQNPALHMPNDAKPGLGFVTVVVIIASLGGLLFGYDTGVIAGANGFLKSEFHMTAAMTGLVSSSIDLGAMVGVLIAGYLGDKLGRKKALMIAGLTFVLCSLVTALANGVPMLVIGRFCGGLGIGLASLLSPLYIAEIAPAKFADAWLDRINWRLLLVSLLSTL